MCPGWPSEFTCSSWTLSPRGRQQSPWSQPHHLQLLTHPDHRPVHPQGATPQLTSTKGLTDTERTEGQSPLHPVCFGSYCGIISSLFVCFWPNHTTQGILVPWPGIEHGPQQWQHRVPTTAARDLPSRPVLHSFKEAVEKLEIMQKSTKKMKGSMKG